MRIDEIYPKLEFPFTVGQIEWRLMMDGKGRNGKRVGLAAPYVKSRAIQDRLDQVVGPAHWQSDPTIIPVQTEERVAVTCRIGIFDDEMGWVWKGDGAGGTAYQTIKGGFSAALKRVASLWSIGRYLYYLPEFWTECIEQKDGKYVLTKRADVDDLNGKYIKAMNTYMRDNGYSAEEIRIVTGQTPAAPKQQAPRPKTPAVSTPKPAPQEKNQASSTYKITGVRYKNGKTMLQLQNETEEPPRIVFLDGETTLQQGAVITNIQIKEAKEKNSIFHYITNYELAA